MPEDGKPSYGDAKHAPGGHYSARNPVPNIHKFLEKLDIEKKHRDERIDAESKDPSKPKQAKKGLKTVTDPTTGNDVQIQDVETSFLQNSKDPNISIPNANLGKDTTMRSSEDQSGEEYKHAQDVTAPPAPLHPGSTSDVPIHGESTNVLFHPTPTISYEPMYVRLEKHAMVFSGAVFAVILLCGKWFGGALYGLVPMAIFVAGGIMLWSRSFVQAGRRHDWASERERGKTATLNLIPESVEWVNTLLGVAWGLMNPDMFSSIANTLEDVMQASVPAVVENVRVAEINQGSNPIRLLSVRALPDAHMEDMKKGIREHNKQTKDPEEAAADEEGGEYYNLECSFAYYAKPTGAGVSAKAGNMHMELVFYLGVRGLFGVPIPIWVELKGIVGTVRLRLQMSPQPPFLKALTFTLMGLPKVQVGCMPMTESGINIFNLPLISKFVDYAIGAAALEYVAPKSMTMDLSKMLVGDDIQKDVEALGILWIRIHKATNLSKQDSRGSTGGGSDPYITVSFSKYGKPMYCTRVIQDDLNPIWEETCALLVTPDLIKANEQLSMELWDSDRTSADDVVGKVELSMQKLIQHPSKMYPHVSQLYGVQVGSTMPGHLHWEVGYFGKPHFRPALRSHGKDINLPDNLRDKKELQDDKGSIDNKEEDAVTHTPPDPLWPSGVCGIVVHQIVNLQLDNPKGSNGNRHGREYEPAKEYGEAKEESGKKLPSSYCTIHYNDELVYRTRSKVVSSRPIFNAGTERFMRDWRSGILTVTVRDQRMREHDPILGIVPLKLSDVLQTSSQVTRWYPLDGGIGFGHIRISLIFRSVETRLPLTQLGWEVGTFEFTSDKIQTHGYNHISKLKMRAGNSHGHIARVHCRRLHEDDGDGVYWDIAMKEGKYNVRLPIKHRYRSAVVFEFHRAGIHGTDGYSILWLNNHLEDNKETDIDLPIWKTDRGMRLRQNYITEENYHTVPDIKIEEIGRLQFRGRFKAGTDESHTSAVMDNDTRETQEVWEACYSNGVRSTRVERNLPPAAQKLHDESLTQSRDVLRQADEDDKQKWIAKDGTDWSGAFGLDPAVYANSTKERRQDSNHEEMNDEHRGKEGGLNERMDANTDDDEDPRSSRSGDMGSRQGADGSSGAETHDNGGEDEEGEEAEEGGEDDESGEHKPGQEVTSVDKKDLHRKHRGIMQLKPVRNLTFAKDESKVAARKALGKMKLEGRQPGVESEY